MKRAVALLLAGLVVIAALLSPLSDSLVARSSTLALTEHHSVRQLNYELKEHRQRSVDVYRKTIAGTPAGVTNVYVMGSSDFGTRVEESLPRFLPHRVTDFDAFLSGRGGTASLYHAIELGAVADDLPNGKVVLMIAPQWFVPTGITSDAFASVFSQSAWQEMLANPAITPATRHALIHRAGAVYPRLCTPSTPCDGNAPDTALTYLGHPEAVLAARAHSLREIFQGRRVAASYSNPYQIDNGAVPIAQIDWAAERVAAARVGVARVTNEYNMADSFYERRLQPHEWRLDGWANNQTLTESPEYDDLRLFLQVARDTGTEVLMISQPVNGRWEDFTQLPKAERQGCYDKIRQIADEFGVQLADFSANEYAPYYFFDNQHLGWRGWIDVNEAIYRFAA